MVPVQLSKETFVFAIEAIQTQMAADEVYKMFLKSDYKCDVIHDNKPLLKSFVRVLSECFGVYESDYCPIEHYCFKLDFGNVGEGEFVEPGEFYDSLINGDYA